MSESHEPSYYEIALTNRQVLTIFVVLLVCVVAAFFSGVWIGRRGTAALPVVEIARAEPEPTPEDAPLKELRFFSDEPQQAPAPPLEQVADEPNPETTLLQDLGGREEHRRPSPSPAEAPPAEAPAAEPPSDEPPAPQVTAEEPAEVPADEPAEVAVAEPAPAPEPPADIAPEPAVQAGELVVQVFFSSDRQRAQDLVSRLGSGGFPAYLSPVQVGEQVMYRVRLGPYAERSLAEAAADRVRRTFKLDTWITQ